MVAREGSPSPGAERRLIELGIKLPAPPQPFGIYVEAVQTGKLLFLSGMLPTDGREAKFIGRVGAESVHGLGRKHHQIAGAQGFDGFFDFGLRSSYHVPMISRLR